MCASLSVCVCVFVAFVNFTEINSVTFFAVSRCVICYDVIFINERKQEVILNAAVQKDIIRGQV